MNKEQKITGNIKAPNKNLDVLRQNFPSCFDKNGEFDFEKFKAQLQTNEINFSKESYGMEWLGKSYARLLATDETTTLLKEDEKFNQKDENKTSENLLIKGDNLEVLKHLSNAYYEKIKMIYIDPPYNTGSDGFVYADDRKFTIKELQELAGIDEERAKRILDFAQSKSNSHSAWLTFMYPRLYIAKQLLKDDGVIFVSIDDNEVAQLRLLMDDIFGEENTDLMVWNKEAEGKSGTLKQTLRYRNVHESIVIGYKNKANVTFNKIPEPLLGKENKLQTANLAVNNEKENLEHDNYYEIISPDGVKWVKHWKYEKDKVNELIKEELIYWGSDGKKQPRLILPTDHRRKVYSTSIIEKGGTTIGRKDFEKIMPENIFSYPKPISLLNHILLVSGVKNNDTILDFFAGSGTTGDAVMQLNAEDGGNRKFILVQLPELIDKKSNKTAYDFVKDELKVETPTIFEITKERLIRAAKKINTELDEKTKNLEQEIKHLKSESQTEETRAEIEKSEQQIINNSFKVFETMPIWEDYNFEAEELEKQIGKQTSLFDESKLTKEDIKALLVTWKTYDGISLTQALQEIDLNGYAAHYSSEKLYLMDKGFAPENLKALLEKIDSDKGFNPSTIIAFAYHFESKSLREISENIKSYANKKSIDIDFITRY